LTGNGTEISLLKSQSIDLLQAVQTIQFYRGTPTDFAYITGYAIRREMRSGKKCYSFRSYATGIGISSEAAVFVEVDRMTEFLAFLADEQTATDRRNEVWNKAMKSKTVRVMSQFCEIE
jgi:hypothetical protein